MPISKCRRKSKAAFVNLKRHIITRSLFFPFFHLYAIDYFEITVWFTEQRVVKVIQSKPLSPKHVYK